MTSTVDEIRRDTIVHERTAMLTHRRHHARSIDEAVRQGRVTQAEAAFTHRVLGQFANDLAIGLHTDADPAGVREAMKPVVQADGERCE